jgi:hypothetical protein
MRRRTAVIVGAALVAAGLPALAVGSADALQAPVTFTSAALPTYQTNGIAWAVASAQGKVFVGGTFTSVRPGGAAAGTGEVARANFVVLDAATGAPTSCAPAFTRSSSATVRSIAASPDGKTIYVGGLFSSAGGQARNNIAALDVATCTIVSTFKPSPNATVRAIKATASKVFYGGDLTIVSGVARKYAAAAGAVGAANAGALLAWAPQLDLYVRSMNTKPDDSVVVIGGNFDNVNGVQSNRLVVVDSSTGTTNVKTFTGLQNERSVVKSIAVDSTGFYTGNEGTQGFDGREAYSWSTYGKRWRDSCLGATQAVVVYQGLLYFGSHAHDCTGMGEFPDGARNHLLVESVNDPHLLSWFPQTNDGMGEALGPRGMVVATGSNAKDYMYVVGEFTTVNGVSQTGITRFGPGPDTVAPSTPVVSLQSVRAGQVRVTWRASTDTDDSTLTYKVYRGGTLVSTSTATSWFWNRPQQTFTDTVAAGSTQSYTVSASDGTNTRTSAAQSIVVASGTPAYAAAVLADSPMMYLRYDETGGGYLSDTSSGGSNLTTTGSVSYRQAPAVSGTSKSLTFSGATSTAYGEARLTPVNSVTIETWFKTTTTVGGKIVGFGNKQSFASSSTDRNVYMTNAGKIVFGVYSAGYHTITTTGAFNNGAWHHLVAVQSSTSGMVLYIDGVSRGTNSTTGHNATKGYWHVGGDGLSSGWPSVPTSLYFAGSVDETAIYSTALSAARVGAHYAAR